MQNKIILFQELSKQFFKNKKLISYFLYALNIIMLDRITKYIALYTKETYFAPFQRLFHLPPVKNYGMSFNLVFLSATTFSFLLKIIGIVITIYFIQRAIKKYRKNKNIYAEITIIAGAIGNLIDRFYYSFVIDFIFFTFPFTNYIAIANIADFAITIGSLYLIFEIFIQDIIYKKKG